MNNDRSVTGRRVYSDRIACVDLAVGVLEMNMHEECLKRQNEGYHTPLSEVIERIERDSKKLKPSYAVLDIEDAIYYMKYLNSLLQKAYEKAHEKAMDVFINGEECPKRN